MYRVAKPAIAFLMAVLVTGCGRDPAPPPASSLEPILDVGNGSAQLVTPFPRHVQTDGAKLVYHAPQTRSWTDFFEAEAVAFQTPSRR